MPLQCGEVSWISFKNSSSALPGPACVTAAHDGSGGGRDKPGNCSTSGLAPWAVQGKPKRHHHPLCSKSVSDNTTNGWHSTILTHHSSLPTHFSNWCPMAAVYQYESAWKSSFKKSDSQVHQPCVHRKLKLVLPASRVYGLNNSFDDAAVNCTMAWISSQKRVTFWKASVTWEPGILSLCKSQGAAFIRGQGFMCLWGKKIGIFQSITHWSCISKHTEIQLEKVLAMRKIMTVLNNCLADSISINSYSDMSYSHLSPTNCNMTIRSPGHVRKWLWTQSFLRSKGCPTFHNDVGEQKSPWSSNGLQGWADNKHSLIKLFEKVRLPLGLLWEQRSSWFIAIQCPSFVILM